MLEAVIIHISTVMDHGLNGKVDDPANSYPYLYYVLADMLESATIRFGLASNSPTCKATIMERSALQGERQQPESVIPHRNAAVMVVVVDRQAHPTWCLVAVIGVPEMPIRPFGSFAEPRLRR
jgi:hypothetical protein